LPLLLNIRILPEIDKKTLIYQAKLNFDIFSNNQLWIIQFDKIAPIINNNQSEANGGLPPLRQQ